MSPLIRYARSSRTVTRLTPPRLSSLPREREQLEFSSRSLVFASDGARVLRAWGPPERPWVVGVEPAGGGDWRVTAWGRDPPEARRAVRELFSLDHPIERFYGLVRREPVLRGTERTYRGLRIPRDAGLYEALLHSVVAQQLSVAAANTIKRRIFERAGAWIDVEGVELPRVPAPAELAGLGVDGLRAAGASGSKAQTLLALARRERSGAFAAEGFATLGSEAAVERLDREPGVGRWTAENVLLRGLGRCDLFIAGDLGLRAALDAYGAVPRNAPEAAARAWGDLHYPSWGSYATLYLWRRWVHEGAPRGPGPAAPDSGLTPRGSPRRRRAGSRARPRAGPPRGRARSTSRRPR